MRRRNHFWSGFAVGAASGVAALLGLNAVASVRQRRVLRLERSLQIGKQVGEVFDAWTQLERLPAMSELIRDVESDGRRSRWVVHVDGKDFEWVAELVRFIPGQAIGWKSVRGPKHTGRITFTPLGDNTLVQVTMNYVPPLGIFSRTLAPLSEHLEDYIDRVLRDFKAALEGKGGREPEVAPAELATGTLGAPAAGVQQQASRFGGVEQAVEYTRPTQPAPFSQPDAKR
jgi:uncharacterized membrane protein